MKSPRFALREAEIKQVFSSSRLSATWRHKVRRNLRNQHLPDPIEHLDFHINLTANCTQLETLVCSGHYLPAPAHRILMEKSKGLCRQIVLPSVADALVLQCLSDALYADIKGKAPSKRSFFEPEDHAFSKTRKSLFAEPRYGSFRAWLDFQKELFNFTKTKRYIAITDIANYYDFISYAHLRNIIAGKIQVRESVLDMLIFILSGLLWQPDYAPRIEIGLPQMDLDAARILEKILNRLITIAKKVGARFDLPILHDILRRRPASRTHAFAIIESNRLTPAMTTVIVNFLTSTTIVDDLAYIEAANALVHCEVRAKPHTAAAVETLVEHFLGMGFFGVYGAIWLLSKYGRPSEIYRCLMTTRSVWEGDAWLGRVVGGVTPIFYGADEEREFQLLLRSSRNPAVEEVMRFHTMVRGDSKVASGVRSIIIASNTSKRLGITHAKFLVMLSILANDSLADQNKRAYIEAHRVAWNDAFYRWRARSVLKKPGLRSLVKP